MNHPDQTQLLELCRWAYHALDEEEFPLLRDDLRQAIEGSDPVPDEEAL